METINNLANSASKMIYGENNQNTATGTNQNTTTGNNSGSLVNEGEPTNTTSSTTGTSSTTDRNTAGTGTTTSDSEVNKSSATANAAQDVGSAPPESGGAKTNAEHQGAGNPHDEPDHEESKAIAEKNKAADAAVDEESGSSGTTGGASGSDDAGPKPLGGGDAGGPAGGASEADKEALGSQSKEPGTGEKYIKSSGTVADGGDFDAANAGAGREANRLLEEKGVHREAGNQGPPQEIADQAGKPPGHKSVTGEGHTSLKDKLHLGSKSSE